MIYTLNLHVKVPFYSRDICVSIILLRKQFALMTDFFCFPAEVHLNVHQSLWTEKEATLLHLLISPAGFEVNKHANITT